MLKSVTKHSMNTLTEKRHEKTVLSLKLLYAGFYKVGGWWNFTHLTSSFYRLYLITNGSCTIKVDNQSYQLSSGDLFLVPKYTKVSYLCEAEMEHYYICLIDGMTNQNVLINQNLLRRQVRATDLDKSLFKRLIEISPSYELQSTNPADYDNKKEVYLPPRYQEDMCVKMEQEAILLQLFSRFITTTSIDTRLKGGFSHNRISNVIHYIHEHISDNLSVTSLSELMCVSTDYFTKTFKKVIGLTPIEYIQRKRVEKACALLRDTTLSTQEITEMVGFSDKAQFSKLFKRLMEKTPGEYRKGI
jgi:AraC-like DNA-binding protein